MAKDSKEFVKKSFVKKWDNVSCRSTLNLEFNNEALKRDFLAAYRSKREFEKEGIIKLHSDPFQCCEMYNFMDGDEFLQELRRELKSMHFYRKDNDLYKFKQSNDFKKLKLPYAQAIRKFLLEDFRFWVSHCTGIELLNMIDMTSSEYSYTDVLLCHDDELNSRRIAFTLYFVDPSWSNEDGGRLDLFGCDDHYEPTEVLKSVYPTWNKLAWFEVSEYSHHQVSEVLSRDKCRLSVHGWFHSKPVPRPVRYNEPDPNVMTFVEVEESVLRDWINPIYLERVTQASIQLKFEKKSEIELPDFLKDDKYHALTEAFKNKNLQWKLRGPPNKRCFQSLDVNLEIIDAAKIESSSAELIRQCTCVMASEAMFLILSNMTGLRFHKLIPKSNGNEDDNSEGEDEEEEEERGGDVESNEKYEACIGLKQGGDELNFPENVNQEAKNDARVKMSTSFENNIEEISYDNVDKPPSKKIKLDDGAYQPGPSDIELEPCDAKCCFEVRKWSHGSYATANHKMLSHPALDAIMVFNTDGWKDIYGGYTSYIAKDEDQELLTIVPKKNSLNLVYREQEVLSFVKYVNHQIKSITDEMNQSFFDLSFSYFE